ncbi:hypothetical protein AB0C27_12100 [Nonomuraea sp. NPDC048882]|uniref:hypothetical protein n=1 Tax=unclassified Nonomuraea TaxID=2593643 RepID=UPI000ABA87B4
MDFQLAVVADHVVCVTSILMLVLSAAFLAFSAFKRDAAENAGKRGHVLSAGALTLMGSLLASATCLPTWFGISYEDASKILQAIGGVSAVMGATMAIKSLPGFMRFIRPVLRLLQALGALVFFLTVIMGIATIPRAATGYMDIEYLKGDKPAKSRECQPILGFAYCTDHYTLRLPSRSQTDTTYRVNCLAYCGGNTIIRLQVAGCPEAKSSYEITGIVPALRGELDSADSPLQIKTDDMSPGQGLRIHLRRTDPATCPADLILISGKLM